MKRILYTLLAVSALSIAGTPADAVTVSDYPAGTAANGIAASRHNLGGFGRVIRSRSTTEICVFCHTPHHSNTANNLKPLWNRGTSAPTSFTAYGATLGGTTVANTDIGSTTLACLSCHDGVTTFDNLVNAPGKAGVVDGGQDRGYIFAMPVVNEFIPENAAYHTFNTAPFTCGTCHPGENPALRLSLTRDLSNDHPVSIAYNGAVAGLRPTNTVISSIDLTSDLAGSSATWSNGNLAQNRWAVKGFISETATIGDILRDGKVECSSCHDPHFKNESWDEVESTWYINPDTGNPYTWCASGEDCSDGQFLRRVGGNSGSGICRTCHNK